MIGRLLDAIRQVETGGHPDPASAVGDGGRTRGPYQISRAYWEDAVGTRHTLPAWMEDYEGQVTDDEPCRVIIMAYWARHAPVDLARAADSERASLRALARIHNGGPMGRYNRGTIGYWRKVARALEAQGTDRRLP